MAENSTVARPYAIAAFKQASEESQVKEWSDILALLAQLVSDPLLKGVIANPRVNQAQLVALLVDLGGDGMNESITNFVRLLAEYDRLHSLPEIRGIFDEERNKLEGRAHVHVRSAYELDEAQRTAISDSMAKRLGKAVEMSVEVDSSLIGGLLIRAGDTVIDATLRGRLTQLGQTLL